MISDISPVPAPAAAEVRLIVDDLAHTVDFYARALGCEISAKEGDPSQACLSKHGVCFVQAETVAALSLKDVEAPLGGLPQGVVIAVSVSKPELPHMLERAVAAGAVTVDAHGDRKTSTSAAFIRDPDGFLIELTPSKAE